MTPQEDRQEQVLIDMEAANERVYKALHGSDPISQVTFKEDGAAIPPAGYHYAIKGPRKGQLIKDVVTTKEAAPAPAPASGKLSKEDMSRWRDLMATVSGRRTEMDQAIARFEAAEEELDAWIADHTA